MKKILVTLLVVFSFGFCKAQNLVPNPSFEDTIFVPNIYEDCPSSYSHGDNDDKVQIAKGWSAFRNSPDYYNACSDVVGVPISAFGYQDAASGKAFCGLVAYFPDHPFQEWIGARLISPLVMGKKYYISLKVNCAEFSNYSCNNLGILFSTQKYNSFHGNISPPNHAAIYSKMVISDTINWTIISGEYVADAPYEYIVIGNFFDDSLTETIKINNYEGVLCYYFIDDVCVTTDPNGCNFEEEIKKVNIYPNPASKYINVFSSTSSVTIINLLGQEIFRETFDNKYQDTRQINVSNYSNGIYFLQSRSGNDLQTLKFIVQH